MSAAAAGCVTSAPPGWTWAPAGGSGSPGTPQPTAAPVEPTSLADWALRPDPNAPIVHPRDPTAPARLAGTIHDVDLVVDERYSTIAPGFVRQVWAFGSVVPGPVIRVQVGDAIRFHLDNHPPELPGRAAWMHPAVNSHPHSVDLPAAMVGPHDAPATINPGDEMVYEFVAQRAGVWMYRCGAEPALEHQANGMFGMVIVEPEGGLAPVDQELFLVRSEWYVGRPMQSAPMAKVTAAVPSPDFVVLNGIGGQYVDHPIDVRSGEPIRLFLLDAGPNLAAALRIEGVDLTIASGAGGAGATADGTVRLSLGDGAMVEFTLAADGLYRIVGDRPGTDGTSLLGLLRAGA